MKYNTCVDTKTHGRNTVHKDKKEKVQRKLRMAEIQLIKEDLVECERLLGEIMKEIYSADQKTDYSAQKIDILP